MLLSDNKARGVMRRFVCCDETIKELTVDYFRLIAISNVGLTVSLQYFSSTLAFALECLPVGCNLLLMLDPGP